MIKLLETVEELLYQAALWCVLWPKTFIHVLAYPNRLPRYVDEELDKTLEIRFDAYLSPILFLVVCILPMLAVKDVGSQNWLTLFGYLTMNRSALSFEGQVLLVAGYYFTPPLVAAITLNLLARRPISREGLRPAVFIQAYLWGSFSVINLPWARILTQRDAASPFAQALFVITGCWWLLAQVQVAITSLGVSWRRATWQALVIGASVGLIGWLASSWYDVLLLVAAAVSH